MFTKTPIELLLKDFSNLLNKCQSVFDLVSSRRYNENLAILTTAEGYAIAEKAYIRCDQNNELQTKEVEAFVNAFDDFYFELKQVLFHDDDDITSLKKRLTTMQKQYEALTQSFNLL
ncbi:MULTISPECIES: hypothetical protein [Enterococcus]|jgi:RNA polymerase-interacting CarD/CdnL/TRCF family regulator|uniref:Four helix bundle protein n=1 Tax=Enterococcus dispar ATCC 51266 TaxID=1139219 RepID=S1P137_9ENTE|nr:hypothetical protein [Enterococcus dispar]EOT40823.1 hypothetical protein OMK_01739 [Enterococcus dispar ATCC 51266]EOW86804.1 hypothetical protein I569_02167 [Enterococcus dispar ATCC 51266]MCU7357726.1 hypothetical protein [Enterococcus dispar]MDT2706267.1 hypothetical protein [Enterococcus dispar]OJG39748.1 hypothetical protein RV01_GL000930 [Enterococcus dispar]